MIIWLASYPRSGNSLTRSILGKCYGIDSYSDSPRDNRLATETGKSSGTALYSGEWTSFYIHASNSPKLYFIKTHLPPIDKAPFIYIVRDGRSSSWSYFNFMTDYFPEAKRSLSQIILGDDYYGDWSSHYNAWTNRPGVRSLQLNFAQLPDASMELLRQIAGFIHHTGPIIPWKNTLQELHKEEPKFFREGKTTWTPPPEWTPSVDFIFWQRHAHLMETLNFGSRPSSQLAPEYEATLTELCFRKIPCTEPAQILSSRGNHVPWHTHLYRAGRSLLGDHRYSR